MSDRDLAELVVGAAKFRIDSDDEDCDQHDITIDAAIPINKNNGRKLYLPITTTPLIT